MLFCIEIMQQFLDTCCAQDFTVWPKFTFRVSRVRPELDSEHKSRERACAGSLSPLWSPLPLLSVRAARTKVRWTGWPMQQTCVSPHAGGWKSEVEASLESGSGKDPLPGLQSCFLAASCHRGERVLWSCLEALIWPPSHHGSPTLQPHLNSVPFQRPHHTPSHWERLSVWIWGVQTSQSTILSLWDLLALSF